MVITVIHAVHMCPHSSGGPIPTSSVVPQELSTLFVDTGSLTVLELT